MSHFALAQHALILLRPPGPAAMFEEFPFPWLCLKES